MCRPSSTAPRQKERATLPRGDDHIQAGARFVEKKVLHLADMPAVLGSLKLTDGNRQFSPTSSGYLLEFFEKPHSAFHSRRFARWERATRFGGDTAHAAVLVIIGPHVGT